MGSTPIKSSANTVQLERTRFGETARILREGNIEDFLPIVSKEEMLNQSLELKKDKNGNVADLDSTKEYHDLTALANLFQSISSEAKFTKDIIAEFEEKTSKLSSKEKKRIIDKYKIIYSDFGFNSDLLLKTTHREFGYSSKTNKGSYYKMQDLTQGMAAIINSLNANKGKKPNLNFVNRNSEPSKQYPHMSAIMINDPKVRTGLKNTLELSAFLNIVNTLEFSRAYPYFNAAFILPSKVNKMQGKNFKTASMNQFLFGGSITGDNASSISRMFESKITKRRRKFKRDKKTNILSEAGEETVLEGVEANMSLFTSPQTMINANEKKGHFENIKALVGNSYDRAATPRDPMLPFMTLVSFDIDVAPTRGLMSYKTGRMSIVLHDKNRLIDIAPLIKPDLFGAFGAEIIVEYGWSHPDSRDKSMNNKIGEFLDASRCLEKYMIVNSSFTIDNSGQVKIDLALSAKGPVMFKLIEILKTPEFASYRTASQKINTAIQGNLSTIRQALKTNTGDDKVNLGTNTRKISETETVSFLDISDTSDIIMDGQKSVIPDDVLGQMKEFINRFGALTQTPITFSIASSPSAPSLVTSMLSSFGIEKNDTGPYPLDSITAIINLQNNLIELMQLYTKIIADQEVIGEERDLFLKSIIGGGSLIDPFYNKILQKEIKLNKRTTKKGEVPKYVTIGSIISTIIGNYFLNGVDNSVDEVQLIFYTANEFSGRMRNRSVSSILVDTEKLREILEGIASTRNRIITIESLIAKILKELVHTPTNISYGLKDIYDGIESNKNSDKTEEEIKADNEVLYSQKEEMLRKIYGEEETKFVVPNIQFVFDSLTSDGGDETDSTICRISIYDRHDNPFQSINALIQEYTNTGDFLKSNKKLANIIQKKKRGGITDEEFIKQQNNIVQNMKDAKIIEEKTDKKGKKYFVLGDKKGFTDLKNEIKKYMPYTKIGTQNSAIINASVSTINEAKLNTVYLTRPDRNDELIETRVKTELPLRVMPTQASIEMFGNPWAQFSQMLFLDFGTETSVDNQYIVTGIQHSLSPGKFTTTLKLSYGDYYGPIENASNNVTAAINNKLLEKLQKRKLAAEKKIFDGKTFSKLTEGITGLQDAYTSLLQNKEELLSILKAIGFKVTNINSANEQKTVISKEEASSFNTGNLILLGFDQYAYKDNENSPEKYILQFPIIVSNYQIKVDDKAPDEGITPEFITDSDNKGKRRIFEFYMFNTPFRAQIYAINKLVELLVKFYLTFPYGKGVNKALRLYDSFREPTFTYKNGKKPSASNAHRRGIAFDVSTAGFYTKLPSQRYKMQEGGNNYIETDELGQRRFNVFYAIAESVGFTSFGVGNGGIHIDLRQRAKSSWIYNYNPGGSNHSKDINKGKSKEAKIDKWYKNNGDNLALVGPLDKTKIKNGAHKYTMEEWINNIWHNFKYQMGTSGFAKGGVYDYLPYKFKQLANYKTTIDNEFNPNDLKSALTPEGAETTSSSFITVTKTTVFEISQNLEAIDSLVSLAGDDLIKSLPEFVKNPVESDQNSDGEVKTQEEKVSEIISASLIKSDKILSYFNMDFVKNYLNTSYTINNTIKKSELDFEFKDLESGNTYDDPRIKSLQGNSTALDSSMMTSGNQLITLNYETSVPKDSEEFASIYATERLTRINTLSFVSPDFFKDLREKVLEEEFTMKFKFHLTFDGRNIDLEQSGENAIVWYNTYIAHTVKGKVKYSICPQVRSSLNSSSQQVDFKSFVRDIWFEEPKNIKEISDPNNMDKIIEKDLTDKEEREYCLINLESERVVNPDPNEPNLSLKRFYVKLNSACIADKKVVYNYQMKDDGSGVLKRRNAGVDSIEVPTESIQKFHNKALSELIKNTFEEEQNLPSSKNILEGKKAVIHWECFDIKIKFNKLKNSKYIPMNFESDNDKPETQYLEDFYSIGQLYPVEKRKISVTENLQAQAKLSPGLYAEYDRFFYSDQKTGSEKYSFDPSSTSNNDHFFPTGALAKAFNPAEYPLDQDLIFDLNYQKPVLSLYSLRIPNVFAQSIDEAILSKIFKVDKVK